MNFDDPRFFEHMRASMHPNSDNIEKMIVNLALCHTIVLDERTGKYNASSPDELALVNAAKFFGAEFIQRNEDNEMIIKVHG